MAMRQYQPVVLIVLDGFGVAAASPGNAITTARMPNFFRLQNQYFYTNLQASGIAVGLGSWNEVGNSEVGHQNLGSGRIVFQDLPRINDAIRNQSFFRNQAFLGAMNHVKENHSTLHLVGLLSNGGVHASEEHLYALLDLAKAQDVSRVYVHAILDGRDAPAKSAINFLTRFEQERQRVGVGQLATMMGRYYAMDRDQRWDRTAAAYNAMVKGEGSTASDPIVALQELYQRGEFDEMVKPVVFVDASGMPRTKVAPNDAVIFFNYRPDRARQLTEALALPGFEKFPRGEAIKNLFVVTMSQYEKDLPVTVAFPPSDLEEPLAQVVSKAGLQQIHIAETEKFAHVTYFFDGKSESALPGEEFVLIPSPKVETYDLEPEMRAGEITTKTVRAISTGRYALAVVNFANADMVGHTGNFTATVRGLEYLDQCLGEIVDAVLAIDGVVIITADHGNAEQMVYPSTGEIDKEHSANPVPFLLIGSDFQQRTAVTNASNTQVMAPAGLISDVAPTVLELLGLPQPVHMTGHSLLPVLEPIYHPEETNA